MSALCEVEKLQFRRDGRQQGSSGTAATALASVSKMDATNTTMVDAGEQSGSRRMKKDIE